MQLGPEAAIFGNGLHVRIVGDKTLITARNDHRARIRRPVRVHGKQVMSGRKYALARNGGVFKLIQIATIRKMCLAVACELRVFTGLVITKAKIVATGKYAPVFIGRNQHAFVWAGLFFSQRGIGCEKADFNGRRRKHRRACAAVRRLQAAVVLGVVDCYVNRSAV